MSTAIVLRKKRDGTMTLASGQFPDEHEFSTRMLGRIAAEGWGRVTVELNLEKGKGAYELVEPIRADPENEESPIVSFKFRRVGAAPSKKVVPIKKGKSPNRKGR